MKNKDEQKFQGAMKDGKSAIQWGKKTGKKRFGNDFECRPGKGCHVNLITPKGICTVSPHSQGKGIMSKITKTFIAIGLGAVIYIFMVML